MAVVAGALASCGGAPAPTPHATPQPSPSATADPAVAAVTAVAKQFVEAVAATAKSGDAKGANSLIVPGSPALGQVGTTAEVSAAAGHNFMVSRIDFVRDAWRVDVSGTGATVDLAFVGFGHEADWPSLRPREGDHESTRRSLHLELQLVGAAWRVYDF